MTPKNQKVSPTRGKPASPKAPTKFYRNLGIVLGIVCLLYIISIPIRSRAAESYFIKGDQALSAKNYLAAELQYEKALALKNNYIQAKNRITLVEIASKDPLVLKNFYQSRGESDKIEVIESATAFPENDNAALALSKNLIEKGEYQLAILPAKTASEMSPDYPEAWQYLSIANLKTADLTQISPEARNYYISESDKALAKAKALDPSIQ